MGGGGFEPNREFAGRRKVPLLTSDWAGRHLLTSANAAQRSSRVQNSVRTKDMFGQVRVFPQALRLISRHKRFVRTSCYSRTGTSRLGIGFLSTCDRCDQVLAHPFSCSVTNIQLSVLMAFLSCPTELLPSASETASCFPRTRPQCPTAQHRSQGTDAIITIQTSQFTMRKHCKNKTYSQISHG